MDVLSMKQKLILGFCIVLSLVSATIALVYHAFNPVNPILTISMLIVILVTEGVQSSSRYKETMNNEQWIGILVTIYYIVLIVVLYLLNGNIYLLLICTFFVIQSILKYIKRKR